MVEALTSAVLSGMSWWYFTRRRPPRALAVHVGRVTLTYMAFVVYGAVEIVTHFGAPLRWQLVALMVVFASAANAQIPLLRHEYASARERVALDGGP